MTYLRQGNRKPNDVQQKLSQNAVHSFRQAINQPQKLGNVVTYILKRYVSNGKMHVRQCQGAQAMQRAMQRVGVAV